MATANKLALKTQKRGQDPIDEAAYLADGQTDWPLMRPEERFYLL